MTVGYSMAISLTVIVFPDSSIGDPSLLLKQVLVTLEKYTIGRLDDMTGLSRMLLCLQMHF
jgi:UDP-3-O-[3-hydroxymyristoyl] glucosamine N-acyltransferase